MQFLYETHSKFWIFSTIQENSQLQFHLNEQQQQHKVYAYPYLYLFPKDP